MNPSPGRAWQTSAYQAMGGLLALGFKFVAWLNGLGVLLIIFCSLGLIQTDLTAAELRLPLVAFTGGLALCGLALFWSYLVQASLFNQLVSGHARRTHWIPLSCAIIAYALSLVVFMAGCWFTLGVSSLAAHASDSGYSQPSEGDGDNGGDDDAAPQDQSGVPQFEVPEQRPALARAPRA
ncbi:hypothetical protein KVP10_19405 [Candidimonas humi]|uniref:Transmembrane protein n=1 Tax=Candidimonas humi TaxID=683355 RepID=A0ABV8NUM6_9BURK|nr:hypothetical protein [Candidimonas humi]MBV6307062.1 hypothetical protein [Candidimonas humi]